MSHKEIAQITVLEQLSRGEITQVEAGKLLRVTPRQVRRKLARYLELGHPGLLHRSRGTPSNNKRSVELSAQIVDLVRSNYPDFGPTLVSEKIFELHGIAIGKESLRTLLTETGIWVPKKSIQASVHIWRDRKDCVGELVQLDGSHHDWFEGRAPQCCLIAFIDDATSQVVWMELAPSESTESLLKALGNYLESWGKPLHLYTDRGGVYKVNIHNEDDGLKTQFGRALSELDVGVIHARSPQAKGRVERLFKTLQDRLVKELRLRGISDMESANIFLRDEYAKDHNDRFAVAPKSSTNLHSSVEKYDLPSILCVRDKRVLQNDWCISYQTRWFQLDQKQVVVLSKREEIQVHHLLSGEIKLRVRGKELRLIELLTRPVKPRLLKLKTAPIIRKTVIPSPHHPWRAFREKSI